MHYRGLRLVLSTGHLTGELSGQFSVLPLTSLTRSLQRQDDGTFKDSDLANILQNTCVTSIAISTLTHIYIARLIMRLLLVPAARRES